jgi:RNA polymerase sigma-70 factor (ECF subfamily)
MKIGCVAPQSLPLAVAGYNEPALSLKPDLIAAIDQQARTRWPGVAFDREAFLRHVDRLEIDVARLSTHGVDLYLASTVLGGDREALRAFDTILASVVGVASRVDRSRSFLDDVSQELRVKLLTGNDPKLRGYSGVGPLREWLRVAALRTALNLKRSDRLLPTDDVPVAAVLDGLDDAQMRNRYLPELNAALERVIRELSVRERTLLRLHFVDGLNLDRIAVIYRVHRATVARWLVAVRRRLLEELQAVLGEAHGVGATDVRSLYRRMQDDVHVTISRVLRA